MIGCFWMSWAFDFMFKMLSENRRNHKNVGNDGNLEFLFCRVFDNHD